MVRNAKIWGDIKKDLKALSFLSVAASKDGKGGYYGIPWCRDKIIESQAV